MAAYSSSASSSRSVSIPSKQHRVDHRVFLSVVHKALGISSDKAGSISDVRYTQDFQVMSIIQTWGPGGSPGYVSKVSITHAEIPPLPPTCGGLEFKLVSCKGENTTSAVIPAVDMITIHGAPSADAHSWAFVPKNSCCDHEPVVLWDIFRNPADLISERGWLTVIWRLVDVHPGLSVTTASETIIAPIVHISVDYATTREVISKGGAQERSAVYEELPKKGLQSEVADRYRYIIPANPGDLLPDGWRGPLDGMVKHKQKYAIS